MKKLFVYLWLVTFLIAPLALHAYTSAELKQYKKQGDRSAEWNELVEPAFQAFDGQNFATAYVFLQKAYDKGCRDGLVLYKLAVIHEVKGRDKEAAKVMTEAVPKLKKDYPNLEVTKEVDGHLGRLYFQIDDYDQAMPLLVAAVKAKPDDFILRFITGQVLRQKKKLAEAYENYKQALLLTAPADVKPDPKIAVRKELMVVTYEMKRYDEALSYAEQILAVSPKDELALTYRETIKRHRAMQEQDKALDKMLEDYK